MHSCPACGDGPFLQGLERHFRFSPWCREDQAEVSATGAPPPAQRSKTAANHFRNRLLARVKHFLLSAHFNQYVSKVVLALVLVMVVSVVMLVLTYIESEVPAARSTVEELRSMLREFPSADSIIAEGERKALKVEPLVFKNHGAKKGGVFFSVYQLVTLVLQERATRRASIFCWRAKSGNQVRSSSRSRLRTKT